MQADLEAIRSALLQRRGALVNLTADASTLSAVTPQVSSFVLVLHKCSHVYKSLALLKL